MRKRAIPLVIVLFAFLSAGLLLSQKSNEDSKFQKTVEAYLDAFWKFYPSAATLAGYHMYDGKLEDLSSKNLEKRHEELDTFYLQVPKIDYNSLNPEFQIDRDIIRDALDYELLRHESLVPWEYNPIFYNDIFTQCVRSLLIKDFAPIAARAKNAELRLKELPRLIKQAKENLKNPPQLFTETAIKQFEGILEFYTKDLPQLLEQVPADIKPKLQDNLGKAISALEDYKNFLTNELFPRSTGNFRLGPEIHKKLLTITLQSNIAQEELIGRATADLNNIIKREMASVCLGLFRIMYPNINMDQLTAQRGEEEARNIFIKGVLDKMKVDHPTRDSFLDKIKTNAEEIKTFLTSRELIDLPQETLNIEPMLPELQGITLTRLIPPGLYETSGPYTLEIAPLPADWSEEQANSFLEEYNDYFLPFWTTQKVYPGQFVPLFFSRKYPSRVRNLYPNMPLIRSWPIYVEELLLTSGFKNYDMKLRLQQLKLQLRAVVDFQLEINVHQGGMTKEQFISYMIGKGFASQIEAERKWNRIILSPCDSAFDYAGLKEIQDIEIEYRKIKGEAFSPKEFLNKLLSFGALPLRSLKTKVLQQ